MIKVLVIADDLTGACDAGGQCARLGIPSLVVNDYSCTPDSVPDDTVVLIINTESRHIEPPAAYSRVVSVIRQFIVKQGLKVFKKTDSTLRGNIGAELSAALDASSCASLVFVPAYPQAGRTTRNGIQYVDDIPLAKTMYGKDPRAPVRDSLVVSILAAQYTGECVSCTVQELADLKIKGICIVDAWTGQDVAVAAQKVAIEQTLYVYAGPVGFLHELLTRWVPSMYVDAKQAVTHPGIIVNGSLNPVALEQLRWALENGY
jgi:D-threonate/D-erythronate kinase